MDDRCWACGWRMDVADSQWDGWERSGGSHQMTVVTHLSPL
jgi:hypothetical protein